MDATITCANTFSAGSIASITSYRDTRACLLGSQGCTKDCQPGHALDALRDDRRLAPDMAGLAGSLRRERASRHLRAVPEGASRQSAAEQPVTNRWSRLPGLLAARVGPLSGAQAAIAPGTRTDDIRVLVIVGSVIAVSPRNRSSQPRRTPHPSATLRSGTPPSPAMVSRHYPEAAEDPLAGGLYGIADHGRDGAGSGSPSRLPAWDCWSGSDPAGRAAWACTCRIAPMPHRAYRRAGSLPSTSRRPGSAPAIRGPWPNPKPSGDLRGPAFRTLRRDFPAHAPRCRFHTSGSATGSPRYGSGRKVSRVAFRRGVGTARRAGRRAWKREVSDAASQRREPVQAPLGRGAPVHRPAGWSIATPRRSAGPTAGFARG